MLRERAIGSASADRAAAFSDLAEHHLADSYRLAALILGDRADAEDATTTPSSPRGRAGPRSATQPTSRLRSGGSSSMSVATVSVARGGTG